MNASKLQQRQDNVCAVEENGVLVSSACCAACTAPCDDDPAFTFTAPNTKKTRDCAYITKNDSKLQQRQDNVCGVEENGVLVSSACCAACTPCDDDPAFTFTAPKTHKSQDCAYITKNDSKLQQRQDNVCGVEENGVLVSFACCAACTALVPSVSNEPSRTVTPTVAPTAAQTPAPTIVSDVRTFGELQGAINGGGDIKVIKLPSGTIVFTKQIELTSTNSGGDRQLASTNSGGGMQWTFICPTCDCVLVAAPNSRLFHIEGGAGNVAFHGVTLKNGSAAGVSLE